MTRPTSSPLRALLFALALAFAALLPSTAGAATISAGTTHSCALKSDGTAWCWGSNFFGEQGRPGDEAPIPQQVPGITDARAVSAGGAHTCALRAGGSVLCWGYNGNGQLGDGTETNRSAPTAVQGVSDAVAIAAGGFFTCALRSGGTVVCWGHGEYGELGNGAGTDSKSPVTVSGLSGVKSISAGSSYACAVLSDASLHCWGDDSFDQLGVAGVAAPSTDITAWQPSPVTVPLADVRTVSTGESTTCAINGAGALYCWGDGASGQHGNGTTPATSSPAPVQVPGVEAAQVAVGGSDVCAVQVSGTAQCWGDGSAGQLGQGSTTSSSTPVTVVGLSGVAELATGTSHNCAALTDGTVSCWGDGYRGQLGNGIWAGTQSKSTPTPVLAGLGSTTALSTGVQNACGVSGGALRCWGWGAYGVLGGGVASASTGSPVDITGVSGAIHSLGVGAAHACALKADNTVWCWGSDSAGQLGDGQFTSFMAPVQVKAFGGTNLTGISKVSVGQYTTCALKSSDGTVWCWGAGSAGQLGNGDTSGDPSELARKVQTTSGDLTGATDVAVSSTHGCAVASGAVFCWGYGPSGGVGPGSDDIDVTATATGVSGATQVGVGESHSCALTGGSVTCWGANGSGQLGDGSKLERTTAVAVAGISGATDLAVGGYHACVIVGSATKCWGNNSFAQLGNGSFVDSPTPVTATGLADATSLGLGFAQSCAVRSAGAASCWGDGYYGQLGNGSAPSGNYALTARAAPVAGLSGVGLVPDAPAPTATPTPTATPAPTPQPSPSPTPTPKPVPVLQLKSGKLVFTAFTLSVKSKATCPKKATVAISNGKLKQSATVKPKSTKVGSKKVCSITASVKLSSKLKKAKKLTVKITAKGVKTTSTRLRS